jgi:hypothetical protein
MMESVYLAVRTDAWYKTDYVFFFKSLIAALYSYVNYLQ